MKIKFLGTTSRAKMAHPRPLIDSLTPPPEAQVLSALKTLVLICARNDLVINRIGWWWGCVRGVSDGVSPLPWLNSISSCNQCRNEACG